MQFGSLVGLAACAAIAAARSPPVTMLEIDTANVVFQVIDNFDLTRYGATPGPVVRPSTAHSRFQWLVGLGGIFAVNGKPAKGMWKVRSLASGYTNVPTPGRAIADVVGNCMQDNAFSILHPDGTAIGTIMALGLGGVAQLPGAPASATVHDLAVIGGTGAHLGDGHARAQRGLDQRTRSEDPDPLKFRAGNSVAIPVRERLTCQNR